MNVRAIAIAGILPVLACGSVQAGDLYQSGGWSSLASDQSAATVGDTLTVLVAENASATNSAGNGAKRGSRFGAVFSGNSSAQRAQLDLNSGFDGAGQSGRSGRMVAQISITVEGVMPNGDLRVAGEQSLKINGNDTRIRLRGRVRRQDISATNTVSSNRIADAVIDYNGSGFVDRNSKPGLIARLFDGLGLP